MPPTEHHNIVIRECPRCNGKGRVHDREEGVFTLGLTTLFELLDPEQFMMECPRCGEKGFIKVQL